ncbi:MAG: DEAD/DEAH box helicase [Clostridia bacterium]|nr:DEAD/DEAH box helicase [Clostridia bacterium]
MDQLELELQREAPKRGEELLSLIEGELPAEENLRMEITLVLPRAGEESLRAGLRIGQGKWYVVKDIPQFLEAWREKSPLNFQSKLVYEPSWMHFSETNEAILRLLDRMLSASQLGKWMPSQAEARLLRLPDNIAGQLLRLLEGLPVRVMDPEGEIHSTRSLAEKSIPMQAECRMMPRGLAITLSLPEEIQPLTQDCAYGLAPEGPQIIPINQRTLLRFLLNRRQEGLVRLDYPLQAMDQAVGEVLPYLKTRCAVEMSEELREMLVRKPLESRVYLDRDGRSVVAKVLFKYGDMELNPFGPSGVKVALERGEKLLLRDAEGEHAVLDILANAGFRVTKENIRLSQEEALFRFLNEGVKRLGEVSEIFLSRDFRRMENRRPALRGGLRMESGSLLMNLEIDGAPTDEILGIMEALSRSRQYYRMKDGTFLNLEALQGWQEGAEAIREAAERDGAKWEKDALTLRGYRAGYLVRMLQELGLPVEADESAQEVAEEISGQRAPAPAPETGIPLRDYQRRGYEWMYMLDRLHMGGVLADDMGLGKTVQVIALLKATRQPDRTSLIVAPTSLVYNWLSEIKHFAPDLSAAVVTGALAQRERMWAHLKEHGDVDVVITSYPLIRRDLEYLAEIPFRFAVLDEAQNIKNASSQVAIAARKIQADTRLALTGTPMENGVGELWSIFDFVLPGYLPGYNAFLRRYQDGMNSEQLRNRIRPFLTRRLKQDVASELPDKVETRLVAAMTVEQRNVYRAAMERLRPKVQQVMEEKGPGRGHFEVLSALTELREICCDPGLVLEGYDGGSGKEEMLMELLPGLIKAGRRVLIFSQFTSMLKKLWPHLEREGYTTLYLDGETPAGERLEMTEKFNGGEGQIFLISLRAGGSGLNLTGADVVIHYDPWWNPAAEEQATDRAHRIGQTKQVDVIRLVMGESIEEKVVELGERKKALFDRLITPGESGLEALSAQDIRGLFD